MEKKLDKKLEKKCFIITPIGGDNTEVRRKSDGVIEAVIKPILKKIGFEKVYAAHQISLTGSINRQVINSIINDELVIANLTELNPNVMYELAIRHATMKPIVHIAEKNTALPFDIVDQRTVFYNDDMFGVKELSSNFEKAVRESIDKENKDNPIYNAIEDKLIKDTFDKEPGKNFEKYLLDKLDTLDKKFSRVNNLELATTSLKNEYSENYYSDTYKIILKTDSSFELIKFINNINSAFNNDYAIKNHKLIYKEESDECDGTMQLWISVDIIYSNKIMSLQILEKAVENITNKNFEVISIKEEQDIPF